MPRQPRDLIVVAAPPDHHLLVTAGHVALPRGPTENAHPSIDALFHSAARVLRRYLTKEPTEASG